MLYTVANEDWTPGSPLPASKTRGALYRTRRQAEDVAAGRWLLAVAVRYDVTRGAIIPTLTADRGRPVSWSSPAVAKPSGGIIALASIPPSLVQVVGPARFRVDVGHSAPGNPHALGRKTPTSSR